MSHRLRVDVKLPLPRFRLEAAFATGASSFGLFGASGSGKTTLLEAIAGLRRGAEGTIVFDGATWLDASRGIDVPAHARGVGYVPQEGLLFPHWDARRNVLAGQARANGGGPAIDPDHAIEVLDLGPLLGRRVETLSGGEKQRVALARALCSGPSLLLLDEPLASIDAPLRGRILPYLIRVRDEFAVPTLFVSHDAMEVTVLCEEVALLRDGRIAAVGRPGEVFAGGAGGETPPPEAPVEEFENVLEGTVVEVAGSRATVRTPGGHAIAIASAAGARPGARALVGVRAGEWMLALAPTEGLSARNVLPGTVSAVRVAAGRVIVRVALGEREPEMVAVVTDAALQALGLREGLPVRLVAKAQACRLLALR